MIRLRTHEDKVTVELPKTVVTTVQELDEMIAKLQDAKQVILEYRQRRLEESVQPLWENME